MDLDKLKIAILEGDLEALSETKGVSKKIAEKMILELKGKVETILFTNPKTIVFQEAEEALISLGYRVSEIKNMLKGADQSLSTEELIKYALKKK